MPSSAPARREPAPPQSHGHLTSRARTAGPYKLSDDDLKYLESAADPLHTYLSKQVSVAYKYGNAIRYTETNYREHSAGANAAVSGNRATQTYYAISQTSSVDVDNLKTQFA